MFLFLPLFILIHAYQAMGQDCSNYYISFKQKLIAQNSAEILKTQQAQEQFARMIHNLPAEEKKVFLRAMMEVAENDYELADGFTKVLNSLYKENLINSEELVQLLMTNNSTKVLFDFNGEAVVSSYSKLDLNSAKMIPEYKWDIINLNLAPADQDLLVQNLLELKLGKSVDDIPSALSYMASMSEKDKGIFLKQIKTIGDKNPSHTLVRKFQKNLKRFALKEENARNEIIEALTKERSDLGLDKIKEQARKQAREERRIFENLYNSCKGGTNSESQENASKKFRRFRAVMGMSSNIVMYSYTNWDKNKDFNWFAKLGYELAMGEAMGYLNTKIVTNPKASYWKKAAKNYGVFSVSDAANSALYGKLFGVSNKAAEKKIEDLKMDPQFQAEAKRLHELLDQMKADEGLLTKINAAFTNADYDPEKLTPKDLEDPEMHALFLEIMSRDLYYESAGGLIQTGSTGMDRYTFSRLYGVIASTKGMAVNLMIYHILCMGGANPQQAYLKAGALYVVDNLITSYYYYKFRKQMINQ